jgi:hypothetical protein
MPKLPPPPVDQTSIRWAGWLRDFWNRAAKNIIGGTSGRIVTIDSNGDTTESSLDSDKVLEDTDISGTTDEITVSIPATGSVTIGIDDPLKVTKGGTGTATLTDGGILLGSGTDAVTPLGQATNGQIPIGSTGADPVLSTITGTANEVDVTNAAGSITIGIVDPLIVGKGGTGLATLTDGGILLGSGTGAITPLAQATNGQLPIGSTGADPVLATLTGTTNQITVTNGAGSVTLSTPISTQSVSVADIDDPSSEFASLSGSDPSDIIIAYEVVAAGDNLYTMYRWDSDAGATNTPYVVAGTGGKWVAVGGRYTNDELHLKDSKRVYFGTGSDASISYDGTDLQYASDVAGTGDHVFTGRDIRKEGNGGATSNIDNYAYQAGSYLRFYQSNGSKGSETATTDGQAVGYIWFYPHNGSSYQSAALIYTLASGNHSGTNEGLDLDIMSTRENATTRSSLFFFDASVPSITINDGAVDIDFRVKGDTAANLLYVNAGTDKIGINKAAPDTRLDVNGDFRAGDGTNYTEIKTDGELFFGGDSGGLIYGEIYAADIASDITLAAQSTWYQITVFDTNGLSNTTTPDHTNDHITITRAGKYYVAFHASTRSGASNDYEIRVFRNNGAGSGFASITTHRTTSSANALGSQSAHGIIELAANDTLELWIQRNDGGAVTKTITFEHVGLTCWCIGGT